MHLMLSRSKVSSTGGWSNRLLAAYALLVTSLSLYLLYSFPFQHSAVHKPSRTKIYIITPTYERLVQSAELTRLCNTFRNVPDVHWIVCEDRATLNNATMDLLAQCGVPFTYLYVETPPSEKPNPNDRYWARPRGVRQRNAGLHWLRSQPITPNLEQAVLYMADDDNTYSLQIFEEMRTTKRASTWPVAFAGGMVWEGCVTSPENRSQISDMWVGYKPNRPFPIDMAGFAVRVGLVLRNPSANFDYTQITGIQESMFLTKLGLRHWKELEPKADGCQRILVWHTQTRAPNVAAWTRLKAQGVTPPKIIGPI